ncbi:carboxylesterase family protein [Streptomyces spongiae]|uniref:carboxylesterase family protein n=1 Tax=Streptomyces spongiae TaxID=565072 RepID=UPI002AD4C73B|nr:carboxylesterase family protein [Streptomyces spongiae]
MRAPRCPRTGCAPSWPKHPAYSRPTACCADSVPSRPAGASRRALPAEAFTAWAGGPTRTSAPGNCRYWPTPSTATRSASLSSSPATSLQGNPDMPTRLDPRPEPQDCLYLNIWTQAQPADPARRVMVWLHGGCSPKDQPGPAATASLGEVADVVIVSLNHRPNTSAARWFLLRHHRDCNGAEAFTSCLEKADTGAARCRPSRHENVSGQGWPD